MCDKCEWGPPIPVVAESLSDVVKRHAEGLQAIYDNQTAGDHTFFGALANFLYDINGRGWFDFPA